METKKKKRVLNSLMVLMILIIAFCGVMITGNLKGWFEKKTEVQIQCESVVGIANVERAGVGYSLKKDLAIQKEDLIETKIGSTVRLRLRDENELTLNGSTEIVIEEASEEISIDIHNGEIFEDTAAIPTGVNYCFSNYKAVPESAVCSISVQSGSAMVNVFKGTVTVYDADGNSETAGTQESLLLTDGKMSCESLKEGSLNDFLIQQAMACKHADTLAFSRADLQKVLDDREEQKQNALLESLKNGNTIIRIDAKKKPAEPSATPTISPKLTPKPLEETGVDYDYDISDSYDSEQIYDYNYEEEEETGVVDSVDDSDIQTCTIQIVCNTVLNNMDQLSAGKEAFVPANGVILATSTVEFSDGETVFDILSRVCDAAGIALEYSWTPVYDSYYVEGINNLYEFDCGNESGWMYKVNGWFPNYGCSSYTVNDGDSIVWCYTCNGLGADVGA